MATHVAVWLATGEWPTRHVCHTCDVPACVNPSHLFQGTDADNHKDKQRKGRAAKKLDADMVRAIRAAVGLSQRELAQLAEVSRMTIANVLHYRTWNHLED